MGRVITLVLLATAAMSHAAGAALPGLHDLRWHRRILLVSSPSRSDPMAVRQREVLAVWKQEAADRDLSLVEVSENEVRGVSDTASELRRQFRLDPGRFQVLLIGKDGRVALRSSQPLDGRTLQGAIDAMPMRRAGER